jgi:hypothetical protein
MGARNPPGVSPIRATRCNIVKHPLALSTRTLESRRHELLIPSGEFRLAGSIAITADDVTLPIICMMGSRSDRATQRQRDLWSK